MTYRYLEASMAGSYWIACEVLEKLPTGYKIRYFDDFLEENVTKIVEKDRVKKERKRK